MAYKENEHAAWLYLMGHRLTRDSEVSATSWEDVKAVVDMQSGEPQVGSVGANEGLFSLSCQGDGKLAGTIYNESSLPQAHARATLVQSSRSWQCVVFPDDNARKDGGTQYRQEKIPAGFFNEGGNVAR